jgi:serine/threonine-protein kinase RsbW
MDPADDTPRFAREAASNGAAGPRLVGDYPATPPCISRIRQAVHDLAREAGVSEDRLGAVALAVTEACTNVVLHAYPASQPGHVHVTCEDRRNSLRIIVADDGHGLLARRESEGLGLGLGLIAQLTDAYTIGPNGKGGTRVTMHFDHAPG